MAFRILNRDSSLPRISMICVAPAGVTSLPETAIRTAQMTVLFLKPCASAYAAIISKSASFVNFSADSNNGRSSSRICREFSFVAFCFLFSKRSALYSGSSSKKVRQSLLIEFLRVHPAQILSVHPAQLRVIEYSRRLTDSMIIKHFDELIQRENLVVIFR